jgi:hypothetical protein
MLVLEGKGAAGDLEAFSAAGIGNFKPFNFERDARRPDGSSVRVAFSLVFAADEKARDIGYFTCQQHKPENFWNPAFQNHANGAVGIDGVVMVSNNPDGHRHFVSAFAGVSDIQSGASGIRAVTSRGEIQVVNPSAYETYTGAPPPDLARGAHLAAIRFAVRDKTEALSKLKNGGITAVERHGNLVIPPDAAFGATLIFEGPKQG